MVLGNINITITNLDKIEKAVRDVKRAVSTLNNLDFEIVDSNKREQCGIVKTIYEIDGGYDIGEAFEIAELNGYDFIKFNGKILDVSTHSQVGNFT
ncbi:hypothetical protein VMHJH2_09535 [Streptococcus uberis]|uniref:hypothetical protein n=1 Tax=Streptococcus uberis TaxID=1349 RepID=UPI0021502090|nr:hypothetical protein [Streptococcus uberis]MCR4258760.1 hypothetical protein [Streptococcus uberis]